MATLAPGARVRHLHTQHVGTVIDTTTDLHDGAAILLVTYDDDRYGQEWSDRTDAFEALSAQVWVALHESDDRLAAGPFDTRADADRIMQTGTYDDVYIAQVDRAWFEKTDAEIRARVDGGAR